MLLLHYVEPYFVNAGLLARLKITELGTHDRPPSCSMVGLLALFSDELYPPDFKFMQGVR